MLSYQKNDKYSIELNNQQIITEAQAMNIELSEDMTSIDPLTFICLKEYPNRVLLSHSKIHHFQDNKTMFESRCILFTQLCYLIIRSEIQGKKVLLSKTTFLNHNKCLFMLYSSDSKYSDRLKVLERGKVVQNIQAFYEFLFPLKFQKEFNKQLDDSEQSSINDNAKESLKKLSELSRSEGKNIQHIQAVRDVLEESQLFKEYAYQLKWNMAVLVKAITRCHLGQDDILLTYKELLDIQNDLQRCTKKNSDDQNITKLHTHYYKQLFHLFKLLQTRNYLRITSIQEETPLKSKQKNHNIIMFTIDFSSNPKRNEFINKTLKQNSSQESAANINQQQKDNISNRQKQYIETLWISKNSIRFRIKIEFNSKDNTFRVDVEGESHWILEQFYYDILSNLWDQFMNLWYNHDLSHNSQKNGEENRHIKWQLVQRQKCPAIRERFKVQPQDNLTRQTLISVDRIMMVLLLLETTLKYLFKVSQNMVDYDENYLNHLQDRSFIENLTIRFRHSIRQYQQNEKTLEEIDRQFSHH